MRRRENPRGEERRGTGTGVLPLVVKGEVVVKCGDRGRPGYTEGGVERYRELSQRRSDRRDLENKTETRQRQRDSDTQSPEPQTQTETEKERD